MQAPVLYTGKTKKNERLLKTKQCSANSLPLQTVASHCFNVTFRFSRLSKHTEQSPESIPQCLSIGKFSAPSDFYSLERRTLLEKQTYRMFYRGNSLIISPQKEQCHIKCYIFHKRNPLCVKFL